jgi:uncharacterized protein
MKWVRVESSSGIVVCTAEVADGWWTRFWGLMGRKHLPEGLGLWIKPSSSVQTTFMRFPLDLVYLDADCKVVRTCPRVPPWRFSFGGSGAHTVLELAPGALERVNLGMGDRLTIRSMDGPVARPTEGPRQSKGAAEDGTL